jgi:hypothetical protein
VTRDEALARCQPPASPSFACHRTDGERWFWTFRGGGRDWTQEAHREGQALLSREAELDPPGVDWAPGIVSLPLPDPPPRPEPYTPEPCQCEACRRRRGETP